MNKTNSTVSQQHSKYHTIYNKHKSLGCWRYIRIQLLIKFSMLDLAGEPTGVLPIYSFIHNIMILRTTFCSLGSSNYHDFFLCRAVLKKIIWSKRWKHWLNLKEKISVCLLLGRHVSHRAKEKYIDFILCFEKTGREWLSVINKHVINTITKAHIFILLFSVNCNDPIKPKHTALFLKLYLLDVTQ